MKQFFLGLFVGVCLSMIFWHVRHQGQVDDRIERLDAEIASVERHRKALEEQQEHLGVLRKQVEELRDALEK